MKGIPLNKFKKVASDEHTTTLKHPFGHTITIAHKSVSGKMREQLDSLKLAEGGEVPDNANLKENTKSERQKKQDLINVTASPELSRMLMSQPTRQDKAKGGMIKPKLADGGDVPIPGVQDITLPPDPAPGPAVDVAIPGEQAPPMPASAINPDPGSLAGPRVGQAPQDPQALPYGVTPEMMQPQNQMPAQPVSGVGKQEQAPSAQPQSPSQPDDTYGQATQSRMAEEGYNLQQAGLAKQASAEQAANQAQAKVLDNQLKVQQANQQDYQKHYQGLEQERQAFMQDIKDSHIDPQHYMNSLDVGGKLATAIGLIAGGMGGAVTGQGNPAQQYLQHQIDNDINAQKAELGKKENLLAANLRQFGNMRDATDMTRVMQLDITANKLKAAAAKSGDAMAQARLLQAAGALESQNAPLLGNMAMRKTLLSGANSGRVDPAMMIRANPMGLPPGQQEAALKELEQAKAMNKARDTMLTTFDKVATLQNGGNRIMSPIQSRNQIQALVGPLVAGLSKETAGRFTEQDAGMLAPLFPHFTDNAETLALKRVQLNKIISEKMNFENLKSAGINPDTLGRMNGAGRSKFNESPIR